MYDNGYDVSDYCDIDPIFGDLNDFTALITKAHQRGIKIISDLVINHTSNQHPWFAESCSGQNNDKSDWYHWRDPSSEGGVPNNWLSYFGGSAWTYCETRQQYYYHTFIDSGLYESVAFRGVNNDELHLAFTFEFPFSPWYPGHLQKEIIKKELMTTDDDYWSVYFLDNHDISRHLSRWVDCSLCDNPVGIAKAAAAILLTVKGTPILYYGQEIGMIDHEQIPADKLRDRAAIKHKGKSASRDGCRTPMQWNSSSNAGFSFGQDVEPWLPINGNYQEVNVEAEFAAPDSILNFYQALIKVRKASAALQIGSWRTLIHYPYEHLAYVRETEIEQVA